ncbi:MAG: ATP-binding protein [Burkholderiales bacterium]
MRLLGEDVDETGHQQESSAAPRGPIVKPVHSLDYSRWRALACWVAFSFVLGATTWAAQWQEPQHAQVLVASDSALPAPDRGWTEAALPYVLPASRLPAATDSVWVRIGFDVPLGRLGTDAWAVYLPYLFAGGDVWVNGSEVARMQMNDAEWRVQWKRPFLINIPQTLLRAGSNELLVRTGVEPQNASVQFPSVLIGRQIDLLSLYERRLFWVRTMPQITTVACLLIAGFVLFIWWRRHSEVIYGLFGLAVALWGLRTSSFIVEALAVARWPIWRLMVMGATVGFVVLLAFFTFRLAHLRKPWTERALVGFWLLGVAFTLVLPTAAAPLITKIWSAGLIPIGFMIFAVALATLWRQRTAQSAVMPIAFSFALAAGIHDYLIFYNPQVIAWVFPQWAGHRFFLLHQGANVLLIAMGGLMTQRFIETSSGLEELNRTLESRVADRERALVANFARVAQLERESAATGERQRIMSDLHDGLGSQLFTSLLRVERGDMNERQIASVLRDCIADLRLALDALATQDNDFGAMLGNFMFRWKAQLVAAGVRPIWHIELGDEAARQLPPNGAIQLLRIVQEALTNVLKHAHATRVELWLTRRDDGVLELRIEDDGRGLCGGHAENHHRGLANMRARAERLGGSLELCSLGKGSCVRLLIPLPDSSPESATPERGHSISGIRDAA